MRLEKNLRKWLGDGKTFNAMGEAGLVREIIGSYQASRPETIEQMDALITLANVCGYDGDARKMLGASICEADGGRTLTLTPR